MPNRVAVDALLERQVREFVALIPGVRDGNGEVIHDARIATRRIRAALPVVSACYHTGQLKAVKRTLRRAGRALGRARDLDVLLTLVADVERKSSAAGTAALPLRRRLLEEQRDRRRKLLTKIDDLPLGSLPDRLQRARRNGAGYHLPRLVSRSRPSCAVSFRERVRARADALRHAIEAATGIYVPERAHAARIAIKKLRYLLEFGDAARLWPSAEACNALRRAQGALGHAHDLHLLMNRLDGIGDSEFLRQRSLVKQLLDAESHDYYGKYVARRGSLLEVCDHIDASLQPPSFLDRHASVLAALVVPGALVAGHVSSTYLVNRPVRAIGRRE